MLHGVDRQPDLSRRLWLPTEEAVRHPSGPLIQLHEIRRNVLRLKARDALPINDVEVPRSISGIAIQRSRLCLTSVTISCEAEPRQLHCAVGRRT